MFLRIPRTLVPATLVVLGGLVVTLPAQDRLKQMPGYARYAEMAPKIARSVTRGELRAEWAEDGKSFTYSRDGKRYSYDVGRKTATEVQGEEGPANRFAGRRGGPARGRQATEALSPDSSLRAF